MKHTIDATNKRLGRVASKAASLLMGKNRSNFVRNAAPKDVIVEIMNGAKCVIPRKKMRDTKYTRYSGYPGGLRIMSMEQVVAKKGYGGLFRIAVRGMLPNNKLRPGMLKRLIVKV